MAIFMAGMLAEVNYDFSKFPTLTSVVEGVLHVFLVIILKIYLIWLFKHAKKTMLIYGPLTKFIIYLESKKNYSKLYELHTIYSSVVTYIN